MHNQSRKNIYQPKQGYPLDFRTIATVRFSADPSLLLHGSRTFKCKNDQDFFIEIDRRYVYCELYCQMNTWRAFAPEKFGI